MISAKLVATLIFGLNVFMIFRTLTLVLSWKRGKLSKALSGNFKWICGRNVCFFHFNILLNLEQVCDIIAYVSVEFLEEPTASNNNILMVSLGRLVIRFSSIGICLSVKLGRSTFSGSCGCSSVALEGGFSSHITFVSSESKYGFKRETLYLVLNSAPSLFFKELRFLFDIEWIANVPNHLNENLPPFLPILLWFFRNTFWLTLTC